jgi:hypothetical protein
VGHVDRCPHRSDLAPACHAPRPCPRHRVWVHGRTADCGDGMFGGHGGPLRIPTQDGGGGLDRVGTPQFLLGNRERRAAPDHQTWRLEDSPTRRNRLGASPPTATSGRRGAGSWSRSSRKTSRPGS